MKKIYIPIVILLFLGILAFVVFTKADEIIPSKEKAIEIGEEKYLKFLWMVDGAFNSDRIDGDFSVNGKTLSSEKKIFKCVYNKSKECIGENFEIEFSKLFSKKIDYDLVYGDNMIYKWYSYENGKYKFNNLDNCSINRMPLEQNLELVKIDNNKIIYKVWFNNRQTNKINEQDFILVYEDNEWKIDTSYYYDMCNIRYSIY